MGECPMGTKTRTDKQTNRVRTTNENHRTDDFKTLIFPSISLDPKAKIIETRAFDVVEGLKAKRFEVALFALMAAADNCRYANQYEKLHCSFAKYMSTQKDIEAEIFLNKYKDILPKEMQDEIVLIIAKHRTTQAI